MNQGALDRATFEAIEAYALDRMGVEERAAFEQRMRDDAALREEVELEQENIRAVELGGFQRVLAHMVEEAPDVDRPKSIRSGLFFKYAAAAVLLVGTLWWLNRPDAGERLFAEHFTADPGLPVAMGATDDPAFADAMVSYKEGHYAEARAKWTPLQQQEPWNDTLRYYIAMSLLAEGDAKASLTALEDLAQGPVSAFNTKAEWYLFLAYLKAGELGKARSLKFEAGPENAERARAILAEVE